MRIVQKDEAMHPDALKLFLKENLKLDISVAYRDNGYTRLHLSICLSDGDVIDTVEFDIREQV